MQNERRIARGLKRGIILKICAAVLSAAELAVGCALAYIHAVSPYLALRRMEASGPLLKKRAA